MQANSTHPDYDAAAPAWSRARDVFAGDDAVKAAGARYLPRLEGQSHDEYAAYTTRASFYGATARTLEEHLDLVFRRAQVLARGANEQLKNFVADCHLLGSDFLRYARHVLTEVTVDTFSITDYHQCKTTFNKIAARWKILTSDLPYYMRAAFVAALAGGGDCPPQE